MSRFVKSKRVKPCTSTVHPDEYYTPPLRSNPPLLPLEMTRVYVRSRVVTCSIPTANIIGRHRTRTPSRSADFTRSGECLSRRPHEEVCLLTSNIPVLSCVGSIRVKRDSLTIGALSPRTMVRSLLRRRLVGQAGICRRPNEDNSEHLPYQVRRVLADYATRGKPVTA